MLDPSLRDRLIGLIARTSVVITHLGRSTLLEGIPNYKYLARMEADQGVDVKLLVYQLEDAFGPAGEWWLLQLVSNAAKGIEGTDLGVELLQVRAELARMTPIVANPAATAAVHLFDLRKLVPMCLALLPDRPGLSGFVIPDATSTLVRQFCDSLRYRGAELNAWPRDRIGSTPPVLVIGPLQTSVERALGQAQRMQPVLAMKHVLFPAYIESAADAAALWQKVRDQTPATAHHLIVVFGMPSSAAPPAGMQPLPPPAFTSDEITMWMTAIAKARNWQISVVERSTAFVVTGYASDGPLPVDVVYDRLQQYQNLVNQHRDGGALLQALSDLDGLGV